MRKRKTNGSSLPLLIALACAGGLVGFREVKGAATQKARDRKAEAPYAVVAGTVFRESGLSLPGAVVTLGLRDAVQKGKRLQATSDSHGEFAFRVPPSPATYVVKATLKGFETAEKEVPVSGEQRVDVTLTLAQASK